MRINTKIVSRKKPNLEIAGLISRIECPMSQYNRNRVRVNIFRSFILFRLTIDSTHIFSLILIASRSLQDVQRYIVKSF